MHRRERATRPTRPTSHQVLVAQSDSGVRGGGQREEGGGSPVHACPQCMRAACQWEEVGQPSQAKLGGLGGTRCLGAWPFLARAFQAGLCPGLARQRCPCLSLWASSRLSPRPSGPRLASGPRAPRGLCPSRRTAHVPPDQHTAAERQARGCSSSRRKYHATGANVLITCGGCFH